MKKFISTVFLLFTLLAATAFSQDVPSSNIPRPFVFGGLDLGDSVAGVAGAGVLENAKHFMFDGAVSYNNDGKSNDNSNITRNGHNRSFKGSAYYATSGGWFFGGGARWSRLYTAMYSKEQWHPTVGLGKDVVGQFFSTRLQMDYILPYGAEHVDRKGCQIPKGQCTNEISGPVFSVYFPSPRTNKHLFARFTIGAWRGHMTVTSSDPVLTAKQKSQAAWISETQMTVMWRF